MKLQWSDELAVGYPIIDEQHQELIDRFNAFLEACNENRGKEHLNQLYKFLDRYVVQHFQEEEQLMKRYSYPDLQAHLKEHQEFISRLAALEAELEKAGPTIGVLIHTNKALLYWLTTHIKQIDVALGRFLTSKSA